MLFGIDDGRSRRQHPARLARDAHADPAGAAVDAARHAGAARDDAGSGRAAEMRRHDTRHADRGRRGDVELPRPVDRRGRRAHRGARHHEGPSREPVRAAHAWRCAIPGASIHRVDDGHIACAKPAFGPALVRPPSPTSPPAPTATGEPTGEWPAPGHPGRGAGRHRPGAVLRAGPVRPRRRRRPDRSRVRRRRCRSVVRAGQRARPGSTLDRRRPQGPGRRRRSCSTWSAGPTSSSRASVPASPSGSASGRRTASPATRRSSTAG